ncbi:non-ribosomal peptide synthetase [Streptomyces sp. NL15-2K]|uniref:non-ribosomal peptide synthetase n=1 Tax=Streptomyces sp. NL15-2K TaxID=376149 RepID=UPI000FFA8714|nr:MULTISPECIES: non-ribosomal peptide synthetase [Actinomycetes]WKX12760.1 non-ribosomal peptide synthetase [Kutzneria buriramensis]GCB51424.1 macromolecule metabolism [Streptomyces sp. NL15-2K]
MNTPPQQSITDLLVHAARHHSDSGIGYCLGGAAAAFQEQSHPELLDDALRVLGGLRARGLRPQDKVVLILERPREFLTAFWAAVLGGFVPCPMAPLRGDPERWAAQLTHVDALLDRPLVITSESLGAELPPVDGLAVDLLDRLYTADPAQPHTAAPEDTALLVLTSGSTGNSKAVMLTHANLLASMAAKNGHHRLTAADTSLNWVSFDHVAALLECHLLPLSTGSRQLHVEPSVVLGEPLEFLRLASRHGVTMTFTPNFLLGQLNSAAEELHGSGERLDLTRLRHIVSGGEAVVRATGEAFLDHFAPHGLAPDALWPAFGMTETCAGSVYSRKAFPEADRGREFASLGTPVRGLRIRIADADDRELPEGEVGELQLTGPMVTRGYHNNPAATADAFTADGWFRSGDLGRIEAGRLSLVGRSKDSVIVNGVNYFSHEIETSLEQLPGVAGSYVAAFPTRAPGADTEQLVIAFHPEVAEGDDAALHQVLTAVRSSVVMHWGFRPSVILPLPKDAFPKTSLGKIQRSVMRRRLESGAYDSPQRAVADVTLRMLGGYTPPEGVTEQVLCEIYAEILDAEPGTVSAGANFFDLGGTSLDILRLRNKVAQRLGVTDLEIITVLRAPTVRSLAARLTERTTSGIPSYDPVVPMQTSGTKTPLFCVHPGVGEVLVFVNLAKYFVGDRPFYALRARGFDKGEKPFATFEQMVDCYVAAVRARQPHGPYAIAGYSYGGAVAFEMAKVLRAQGERVDFVGSFNLPPHIKYRMDELDFAETAVNLAFFLALIDKRQALELPGRLRGLPVEEQIVRLMDLAPADRLAELDLDGEKFGNWAELANTLTDLGRSYRPSGTVPSMSVFYAIPLRGTKQDWLDNELRRWDEHTTGPNRYIEVPGEHYTLMSPRHVASFQAILRRELDRALADADHNTTETERSC